MVHRIRWRWLRILPFCLLLLGACEWDKLIEEANELQVGDVCPSLTMTDTNGYLRQIPSSLKPTVIYFFQSTCPDCTAQTPVVQRIYDRYGGRINLIGIARGESDEIAAAYSELHKLTFPVVSDETRRFYNRYATSWVPRIYFCQGDTIAYLTVEKLLTYDEGVNIIEDLLLKQNP